MMHTAVVVGHRIDQRITLDQDEASPGGIEEHHLPVSLTSSHPKMPNLALTPEEGPTRDTA